MFDLNWTQTLGLSGFAVAALCIVFSLIVFLTPVTRSGAKKLTLTALTLSLFLSASASVLYVWHHYIR